MLQCDSQKILTLVSLSVFAEQIQARIRAQGMEYFDCAI